MGKSLLINTTERLKRISVTDDTVADALVVTPTQILVHGRAAGTVVPVEGGPGYSSIGSRFL